MNAFSKSVKDDVTRTTSRYQHSTLSLVKADNAIYAKVSWYSFLNFWCNLM